MSIFFFFFIHPNLESIYFPLILCVFVNYLNRDKCIRFLLDKDETLLHIFTKTNGISFCDKQKITFKIIYFYYHVI